MVSFQLGGNSQASFYIFILLVLSIPLVSLVWYLTVNTKKKLVGYVSSLFVYPVKSGGYLKLEKAEITYLGIKHDRQFVLVNEYGTFMTLRKHPKFVLIKQSIKEDGIYLEAEGMPILKLPLMMKEEDGDHSRDIVVWRKATKGVHVSQEADDWFAKYLELPGCKLYSFPDGGKPRFSEDKGVQISNYTNEKDTLMFADGCPLMVLAESSVENFRMQLPSSCDNIIAERFRPNILVTGCGPYEEDTWSHIEIGDVKLQKLYPCDRCVAINVNPINKQVDTTVLNTLKRVRPAPEQYSGLKGCSVLGCNYSVRKSGTVKLGDPIYLLP